MSDTPFLTGLRVTGTGMYGATQVPSPAATITHEQHARSIEVEREVEANTPISPTRKRGQRPNKYGGKCIRCDIWVTDGQGVLTGGPGSWGVAHLDGACPERQPSLPGVDVPVVEKAPKPKPQRRNQYPGDCGLCGRRVNSEEGFLDKSDEGKWVVFHDGTCPSEFPFPEGRYAVENDEHVLAFYHCAKDGEVYVMASDNEHRLQRSAADGVIAKIALDPLEAAKQYGFHFKRCGLCNRGLTDESSRAAGIGPVCARKGWGL